MFALSPGAIAVCLLTAHVSAIHLPSSRRGKDLPPTEPGCWVWMPTGCELDTSGASDKRFEITVEKPEDLAKQWTRDDYGQKHLGAGIDQDACEETRRAQYNSWCHRSDAQMKFVPGLTPVKPMIAGCYVWLPSGCLKQAFEAKTFWRKIEHTSSAACEEEAPVMYNSWCGTSDARTIFVPLAPAEPTEPGCYVWMPSGCELDTSSAKDRRIEIAVEKPEDLAKQWTRDDYGQKHAGAGINQEACEDTRRAQFNSWCHRSDALMKFVPGLTPAKPTTEGCYVWLPSGCFKQAFQAKTLWQKIEDTNSVTCEADAPTRYNAWCGTVDARTIFVPPTPADPIEPGCYVWMPTGCSRHPFSSKLGWKKDVVGDDAQRAATDRTACEIERLQNWNSYCGEENAKMLFVPPVASTEAPSEVPDWLQHGGEPNAGAVRAHQEPQSPIQPSVPGCYVWMPTGCPRQKFDAMTQWRKIPTNNEEECTSPDRSKYNSWCGRQDAVTLWVPQGSASTTPRPADHVYS